MAFSDSRIFDSRTCKQTAVGTAPALFVHTTDNRDRSTSKRSQASAEVPGRRIMKSKHYLLLLVLAIVAFAIPIRSLAQQATQEAPILTLDEAVSIALANNRLVKNSVLEAQ